MAASSANCLLIIFHYLLLIHSLICFIPSESAGFTLRLDSRFSPESPLYPGNLTFEEKFAMAVNISMARARYLSATRNNYYSVKLLIPLTAYALSGFSAKIQLGTPPSTQTLLVDTGSDLLWTQCKPCIECFPQDSDSMFNPDRSGSYKTVPCNDPICTPPMFQCVDGKCKYGTGYLGADVTRGSVSRETFTFQSKGGTVTRTMIFGCGNDNRGFRTFPEKGISGILGLNMGSASMISQFSDQMDRFSFCLVFKDGVTEVGPMRFGSDATIPPVKYRQLISILRPPQTLPHYYVDLKDISVGEKRIAFQPGTFKVAPDGSGGCVFDLGATYMVLEPDVYKPVMKAFDEQCKSIGLEKVENLEPFKYCYKYDPSSPRFKFPAMTLHFPWVKYTPPRNYIPYKHEDESRLCIPVIQTPDNWRINIIGAFHQQDIHFLYDIKVKSITFAPENCAGHH